LIELTGLHKLIGKKYNPPPVFQPFRLSASVICYLYSDLCHLNNQIIGAPFWTIQ
jgi:hypothetical protein